MYNNFNDKNRSHTRIFTPNMGQSKSKSPATNIQEPPIDCDVMISYSHEDKELALKIKNSLELNKIKVWIDLSDLSRGDNLFDKIGEAISSAEFIIAIVSQHQIKSKFCVAEIALAYISNKIIIPCFVDEKQSLIMSMPAGMRLQLVSFEWFDFKMDYEDIFCKVIERIKNKNKFSHPTNLLSRMPSTIESTDSDMDGFIVSDIDFWKEYFDDSMEVTWTEFESKLKEKMFKPPFDDIFGHSDFKDLSLKLYKEFGILKYGKMKKSIYTNFLMEDPNTPNFLLRVKHYWSEILAVKDVFDIESNLRVKAIESLANFQSKNVIEALLDLSTDEDANTRAVAILTLAKVLSKVKSGSPTYISRISSALDDDDRMVRECACLALGNIGTVDSDVVNKVVYIWRNDVIASVRQCAELALRRFNNEEAQMAIRMTEILKTEIDNLKNI